MKSNVTVACVQAEPVVFDREATLDKVAVLTAEAAAKGADIVVFPETFVAVYPTSTWAKALAGWADPRAKAAFAALASSAVEVPGPAADRLGEIARTHSVWLVTGVNEIDPVRNGTVYNALLY
ncbi:MAG: nitrilase-related carbon-nitrogen hydrolase, partial [Gaiellaceae bacterium]